MLLIEANERPSKFATKFSTALRRRGEAACRRRSLPEPAGRACGLRRGRHNLVEHLVEHLVGRRGGTFDKVCDKVLDEVSGRLSQEHLRISYRLDPRSPRTGRCAEIEETCGQSGVSVGRPTHIREDDSADSQAPTSAAVNRLPMSLRPRVLVGLGHLGGSMRIWASTNLRCSGLDGGSR